MSDNPYERLQYRDVPLDWFVEKIRRREPFAMARWSDGDLPCVAGKKGRNTDQHEYSPKLRHDLARCLFAHQTHLMGLQPHLTRTPELAEKVNNWLIDYDIRKDWINGDVFVRALIADRIQPFIEALNESDCVILVGPKRYEKLRLFPFIRHIVVPDVNCHDDVDAVEHALITSCWHWNGLHPVVVLSAGMSANVIVHDIWNTNWSAGNMPTLIDVGSIWEPYLGMTSRTYMRKVVDRLREQGVIE